MCVLCVSQSHTSFCFSHITHIVLNSSFKQQAEEKLKEYQAAAKRLDNALLVSMVPPNLRALVPHIFVHVPDGHLLVSMWKC